MAGNIEIYQEVGDSSFGMLVSFVHKFQNSVDSQHGTKAQSSLDGKKSKADLGSWKLNTLCVRSMAFPRGVQTGPSAKSLSRKLVAAACSGTSGSKLQ